MLLKIVSIIYIYKSNVVLIKIYHVNICEIDYEKLSLSSFLFFFANSSRLIKSKKLKVSVQN